MPVFLHLACDMSDLYVKGIAKWNIYIYIYVLSFLFVFANGEGLLFNIKCTWLGETG